MNPPRAEPSYSSSSAADADADADVVRRMAVGDQRALGELYDRWGGAVLGLALRVLRDRDEAEDVVEETFWQAWRQAGRYEPSRGAPATWLLTIARTRALDRMRARQRRRDEPLPDADALDALTANAASAAESADDPAEVAERRRLVAEALAELPDEQRAVLALAYFDGLSQTEIADRTGQPLGTVKTRVRLALGKLRTRLAGLREEG